LELDAGNPSLPTSGVRTLLVELELKTLLDLGEAYELDLEGEGLDRTVLIEALLALPDVTTNEILSDLLEADELTDLAARLGLEGADAASVEGIEAALRRREAPPSAPERRPWRWTLLDKLAVAACLFLLALTPAFGRLWSMAFGPEISDFQAYRRMLADPIDPWSNPWIPWIDAMQSLGPNGLDEGGTGDDVVISTLTGVTAPPEVAIYERAPLDYLVALALLTGVFLAATSIRPRGSRTRELALTTALAAPLIAATLWIQYEFWAYWRSAASFGELLVAPAPLAAGGSVVLIYLVGVLAIRSSVVKE